MAFFTSAVGVLQKLVIGLGAGLGVWGGINLMEGYGNDKAYVQSWIEAIRDKPDSLIRAIKDAEAAANYMDLKAGLITEKEYEKTCEGTMEVTIGKTKSIER